MKLYLYCLAQGIDELPESLAGVSGAKVRLVRTGNFSLLVSDFAGDAVAVTRENVLAHAAVVRSVLDETTPLPFRFGTLVAEQQLESYVMARKDALQAKLEQVRDCVEMSVKIISETKGTTDRTDVTALTEKPGTAFLAEKRREILGNEARAEQAKEVAGWIEARLGPLTREIQTNLWPTEKLLLAAAHLVERGLVSEYRAKLAEARRQRPELHFLVSGPWAPYSFANIDLEFKTEFGVS